MIRFLAFLLVVTPSLSAMAGTPVAFKKVEFHFGSQDGEITSNCSSSLLPNVEDFLVRCSRPSDAKPWEFVAHIRVFRFDHEEAPRTSYQILFWVTDRQAKPGGLGKFVGSTTTVRLQETSTLSVLSTSQQIQDTYELNADLFLADPK